MVERATGEIMNGRLRVGVAAGLIAGTTALAVLLVFLLRDGLAKASLWATFLVLPLTAISAIAGVWAVVIAARSLRDGRVPTKDSSGGDVVDRPRIVRSGNVRQERTDGPAVAHTGVGEIIFTGPETAEPSDESTRPGGA